MELIKAIFPYASPEIVTPAVVIFSMTLFGLSLGFGFVKSSRRINNYLIIIFCILLLNNSELTFTWKRINRD